MPRNLLRLGQCSPGAVVTYIDITVLQTSNVGRAYIASGGLEQRHVTIVVEANNTNTFNLDALLYGHN